MNNKSLVAEYVPLPALPRESLRCAGMIWNDSRRFPRKPVNQRGLLTPAGSFAAAGHQCGSQEIWLRDMARGGLGFLHGAQLFPGEHCTITLRQGGGFHVEIVFCRRLADRIFLSGARFATAENRAT